MKKTAWIITFKLKEGISQEDFVTATKHLHDNVVSKADGFLYWEQYLQEDTWTDFVMWETQEEAKKALTIGQGSEEAKLFYNMILMSFCKMQTPTFVKKY